MDRTDNITLEELEDFKLLIEGLISHKKTGCVYPSVMDNSRTYPIYSDTDSIKYIRALTVFTLRTFTDDDQIVLITDKDTYSIDEGLYYGEMAQAPEHLMNKRVSKFYSDYVPTHGSFIGIRIIE